MRNNISEKRNFCTTHNTIAYYSGLGGVEIKGICYGINDYIYAVANAWHGRKSYHKVKVNYDFNTDAFIRIRGYKIPLNECIRV